MEGKLVLSQTKLKDLEFPYNGGSKDYREAYSQAVDAYRAKVTDAARHYSLTPAKIVIKLKDVEARETRVLKEVKMESIIYND